MSTHVGSQTYSYYENCPNAGLKHYEIYLQWEVHWNTGAIRILAWLKKPGPSVFQSGLIQIWVDLLDGPSLVNFPVRRDDG